MLDFKNVLPHFNPIVEVMSFAPAAHGLQSCSKWFMFHCTMVCDSAVHSWMDGRQFQFMHRSDSMGSQLFCNQELADARCDALLVMIEDGATAARASSVKSRGFRSSLQGQFRVWRTCWMPVQAAPIDDSIEPGIGVSIPACGGGARRARTGRAGLSCDAAAVTTIVSGH